MHSYVSPSLPSTWTLCLWSNPHSLPHFEEPIFAESQTYFTFSKMYRFKWLHFLEEHKTVNHNAEVDFASVIVATGLWHMEHAQMVREEHLISVTVCPLFN